MIGISDILAYLEAENIPFFFQGDPHIVVDGFSSLNRYRPGSFTWVKQQENIPSNLEPSRVTLAILSEEAAGAFPNIIRTRQSKRAFFSTIAHFYGETKARPAVGQFTYISPEVKLGKNVKIGHNCTLDGDISIGDNTVIWHHVTILNRVVIGRDCEIQSGSVIGHDGFAYTEDSFGRKEMIQHFGGVSIGDKVLISSNVCVCRGTIDDTVISDGVKIDNLSHIAHNCILAPGVAMAYPCQLGGSTQIEKNGYLAAATIRNQCTIGEGALIGMGAIVVKDVKAGQTVVGNPARPFKKKV